MRLSESKFRCRGDDSLRLPGDPCNGRRGLRWHRGRRRWWVPAVINPPVSDTVMDMEHFLALERKNLADLVACRV